MRAKGALLVLLLALAPAFAQAETALERGVRLDAEVLELHRRGRAAEAIPLARDALATREQALGPAHPDVATSLNNLAVLLQATGDSAAARPLHERALSIREQALGPAHPDVAQSLNNLAFLLQAAGDHVAARPLYERALALRERALAPLHPDVAQSLNNLAYTRQAAGDYAGARPLYERAIAIWEQAPGPVQADLAQALNNLAYLRQTTGDYAGARPLHERALQLRERILEPAHPDLAQSLNNLAFLMEATGDYAGARVRYVRALAIWEQALGPTHPSVAVTLNNLAALLQRTGDYAGARPRYERALRIWEHVLGPAHPLVASSLSNLAVLLRETGDDAGARPLYERALAIQEHALGPAHPDVAVTLNNLAVLLQEGDDHAGARALHARALHIREQALGPAHPDTAQTLHNLAALLEKTGDHAAARSTYERALAIREQALGPTHPDVAVSLDNLGALRRAMGDPTGARPLHARALAIREEALGPAHPDVASSLNGVAAALKAERDYVAARALYERARRVSLAVGRTNVDLDDAALRGLLRGERGALADYIELLAEMARDATRDARPSTAPSDAFVAVEQTRGGAAQRALGRAGARTAASDAATAGLARQVQELGDRRQAVRARLAAEYGTLGAARNAARLEELQRTSQQIDRDLAAAAERLFTAFPRYAQLAAPEPIDLGAVQALLRPDEALVSYVTLPDRVLAWVARPGTVAYRDIPVDRGELAAQVARVRASVDQGSNQDLAAGRLLPVDVAGAHALYARLLEPLRADLAGVTHLIVVPDDVLLPLPFGALVTRAEGDAYDALVALAAEGRAPAEAELTAYARLAWLAKEYALTVLPSATSLRALRQVARAKGADGEPFIGFGDPVLQGAGHARGGAMLAARGAGVAVEALRGLPGLPGTRDELMAVAQALAADPARALYLGAWATKSQVIALDRSGQLGKGRVVAFATHALIAGDVKGLRQPALVLTPPAVPSAEDDGLLSLEDVVGLRLTETEWVILSACNTAASDGSGEGLSGLVRAFFFAGAPSLLVSHWSVDDRATEGLMTEVFRRYAANRGGSRADALRQGMLALMGRAQGPTAYFAHPFAWAAFFLVGEGGSESARRP